MSTKTSNFPLVAPGTYRLCSLLAGGQSSVELAELVAYPQRSSGKGKDMTGQWVLAAPDAPNDNPEDQRQVARLREIWAAVTCRLGLLPPRLAHSFVQVLQRPEPLCLLADTSSLYHGVFEQALRLRGMRPTHVAFPDQAWMELQRQREEAGKRPQKAGQRSNAPGVSGTRRSDQETNPVLGEQSPLARWLIQVGRHRRHFTGTRVLNRIRSSGIIVHHARPSDAMVRYFGAERGSGAGEDTEGDSDVDLAPGYYRDRLILEAARQTRANLSGMRVFLVTADSNFATHAYAEGFDVGFGQQAMAPSPFLVSSPFFDPYDLALRHVTVEALLEELLWQWRVLSLQREGESKVVQYDLPREFELTLLELAEDVKIKQQSFHDRPKWYPQRNSRTNVEGHTQRRPPRTAPAPAQLIQSLLSLPGIQPRPETRAYLEALGWANAALGEELIPTPRGEELARRWRLLGPMAIEDWSDWLRDAGHDLATLPETAQLLAALTEMGPGMHKASDLEQHLQQNERLVRSQRALAHAFGLVVNLGGKITRTSLMSSSEAMTLLWSHIPKDGIRVDRLFTSLLPSNPLGVPLFRHALRLLLKAKQLRPGGTNPDRGGGEQGASPVKVDAIIPGGTDGVSKVTYDLGAGDFLPGDSHQAVYRVEGEGR